MRTAIWQIAIEQIPDELFDFGVAKRIICFYRVAADRFRNHLFSQAQWRAGRARTFQVVDHLAHELRRVRDI